MRLARLVLYLLAIGLLAIGIQPSVQARETLRVLAWPGYADHDLVETFGQRFGVAVEVTFVGSDDELWQRISANEGRDFDVFAVNTAELQRYIDQGLSVPIQVNHIPNIGRQLPRFRDYQRIPGLTRDQRVYGIPYTYSAMGLIYNRAEFATPPDSIRVLWDPRYRGRVLAYNGSSHNFSLAAQYLGYGNPFQIDETAFKPVIAALIALRRNVLTFYSLPEEAVELFKQHAIALIFANYGAQQVAQLRDAGADIGYVIPREGALAWLDCWAITRGARDPALAEAWIDFMLDRAASEALTARQGLANTVSEGSDAAAGTSLLWLEPVEDSDRRTALWGRILSGERPERF